MISGRINSPREFIVRYKIKAALPFEMGALPTQIALPSGSTSQNGFHIAAFDGLLTRLGPELRGKILNRESACRTWWHRDSYWNSNGRKEK